MNLVDFSYEINDIGKKKYPLIWYTRREKKKERKKRN